MKEPTLQTGLLRWRWYTLVIRTPIVMHRKMEFEIRSLYVMKGPHRLWVGPIPAKEHRDVVATQ